MESNVAWRRLLNPIMRTAWLGVLAWVALLPVSAMQAAYANSHEAAPADLAAVVAYIAGLPADEQAAIRDCAVKLGITPELALLKGLDGNTLGGNLGDIGEAATDTKFVCPLAQSDRAADRVFLQIETGGHTNRMRGLAISPKGDLVYSAGDDKTIRVWDVETSNNVETIRGHVWPGEGGQIYALALSPDGMLLAAAGNMGPPSSDPDKRCGSPACGDIRVFRRVDGSWDGVTLLSGHKNTVLGLAISPDGRWLASASVDRTIRVWDVATLTHKSTFEIPDRRAQALVFLPDSRRLAFVSGPRGPKAVRILDIQENQIVQTLAAERTAAVVAVSDDGRFLAAGGDEGHPEVWELATGTHLHTLDLPKDISGLAFGHGQQAKTLVAVTEQAPYPQEIWNAETGEQLASLQLHDNAVHAVAVAPNGEFVATTGGTDSRIQLWQPKTAARETLKVLVGKGRTVFSAGFVEETDLDVPENELLTGKSSAPGRRVLSLAWGNSDPCPELSSCPDRLGAIEHVMQIPGPSGGRVEPPETWPRDEAGARRRGDPVVSRAALAAGATTLSRRSTSQPSENPELLIEGAGEVRSVLTRGKSRSLDHISYGFNHAGTRVASGGRNGVLDLVDPDGTDRAALVGHDGNVWSLAFDPADRLLATGASDQTVRLWNAQTGELVVSLLPMSDGNWVMWTPEGYFAASPGGEKAVGWHINHGPDKPAEFVRLSQLRTHFYRPEIVERAITLASAKDAVSEARATGSIGELTAQDLVNRPRPNFQIVGPEDRAKVETGTVTIKLAMPPDAGEIADFGVTVGEATVDASLESGKRRAATYGELKAWEIDIPLHKGRNKITVQARGKDGQTYEQTLRVLLDREGDLDRKGTLYIVAIGVDRYPNLRICKRPDGSCDLRFAGKDATAFARAISEGMGVGKGHEQVVDYVLSNDASEDRLKPTRQNIERSLSQLAAAGTNDTVVIFVAGHGHSSAVGDNYRFLTTDAEKAGTDWLESTVVDWKVFDKALRAAKGRKLLFVDTCRSAGALGKSLVNNAVDAGAAVYFASGREQDALELEEIAHGAFTFALLEGLGPKGNDDGDAAVTAKELAFYVLMRVKDLTKRRQEPRDVILDDFDLVKITP